MDFGAFVNFFGPRDGLVHISQLAEGRAEKTTDVVKEGDEVFVKLLGFDDRGKVRLSMKIVDQERARKSSAKKRRLTGLTQYILLIMRGALGNQSPVFCGVTPLN